MSEYYSVIRSSDYLEHYGIMGMKWGVRRYQNEDGSLTEAGRKRYGDIMTKDQMKNIVRSYNLRTGSNKKINKNTTFKTKDGKVYDYKGRRINTDTDVADPKNEAEKKERERKSESEKKTDTDKSRREVSKMSDQELRDLNSRMQAEIDYKEKYAKLHPKKVSAAQEVVRNFRNSLVRDVPAAFSAAAASYIKTALTSENDSGEKPNLNLDPKTATTKDYKAANDWYKARDTYEKNRTGSMNSVNSSIDEDDVRNIFREMMDDEKNK